MNENVMNFLITYWPIVGGPIFLWLTCSWMLQGRYIRHLQEVIENRDLKLRQLELDRNMLRLQQRVMMRHDD